ncbi:DUF1871 family protein [Alkalihalobacillus deserti]|uniref:DUF1871 family protein n=1 Tax=Alkalihalobacillus deserti TaxID=2879466 RepID=UPI001D15E036|nr:DUF1871 family protein [Alkalihalobacillus deserti]
MSNKELKEKYNKLFNIIKKIVNDWDPIGLLPSAPDDEYEFEVAKIVTLLNKADSVESLADGIATIFTKSFDWSLTKEDCLPVAQKIWGDTKFRE